MPITRTAKAIVIGLAATTAVAVAGVGYAAATTTTKPLSACANAKNRLAVPSSKGKCPKGYKAVTINKQGPKGATGAKGAIGAKGATGATGPGAKRLYLTTSGSGALPIQVGPFQYSLECDITGSGASTNAAATLHVTAPTGQTASLNGVYNFVNVDADLATPTTKVIRRTFSGDTSLAASSTNGVQRIYFDALRVVGADGTVQVVSIDYSADGRQSPAGDRCSFTGMVIPSS